MRASRARKQKKCKNDATDTPRLEHATSRCAACARSSASPIGLRNGRTYTAVTTKLLNLSSVRAILFILGAVFPPLAEAPFFRDKRHIVHLKKFHNEIYKFVWRSRLFLFEGLVKTLYVGKVERSHLFDVISPLFCVDQPGRQGAADDAFQIQLLVKSIKRYFCDATLQSPSMRGMGDGCPQLQNTTLPNFQVSA